MLKWMLYLIAVSWLLGLAAGSAERGLRVRRRTTRWAWTAAILASIVVPALIASVSIEVPDIVAATPGAVIALRSITSLPLTALTGVPILATGSPAGATLETCLRLLWLTASGIIVLLLAASALQLALRRRRWAHATVAGADVLIAPGLGPAVVGFLRPCIVLPPWVLESSPSCQAHVVAHERAHLEAGDPALLALAVGVLAVVPWNVPLWWQLSRLRRAIEVDCDARVLRAGHDRQSYGHTLIEVGQRQSASLGQVAAMSESASFLEQRIRFMVQDKVSRPTILLACLSVCLIALATQVSPPNTTHSGDRARTVAVSPAVLDRYAGDYEVWESSVLTVWREDRRLLIRVTGQMAMEMFPSSETEYFSRINDARITFETDSSGKATRLILRQNGGTLTLPRIEGALARKIEAAVNARVASQRPCQGCEAQLRRHYAALLAGRPDYTILSPGLAEATRRQLPQLRAIAGQFGAIKSVKFLGVGNQGWDTYEVQHEHGMSTWRIVISANGTIYGVLAQVNP
jgi:beta-lactamase regulating signal transducer with metallopeptidase domain